MAEQHKITPLGETSKTGGVRTRLSHAKRKLFLKCLAECGQLKQAAEFVGLSTQVLLTYRKQDEEFAKMWDETIEDFGRVIESIAIERATGYMKNVWHQGQIVGQEEEFNPQLLQTLLKATNPDKYGDHKKVKVEGGFGVVIAPATSIDPGAWEKKAAEMTEEQKGGMKRLIEGECEVVEEVLTGEEKKSEKGEPVPAKKGNFTKIVR